MRKLSCVLGSCAMAAVLMGTAAFAEGGYEAGTYTATVAGRNADITVEVTFSEDMIEDIKVTDHAETDGIGTTAIDQLPGAIVESQSLCQLWRENDQFFLLPARGRSFVLNYYRFCSRPSDHEGLC